MKLVDRVALVTGAGRGIGRGIALSLAAEGARVAAADFDYQTATRTAAEIKEKGGHAEAVAVDVTERDMVNSMVEHAMDCFGRIDILVNNAGIITYAPVEELTEKAWDDLMAVNVKGTFLCCQAVIRHMKEAGGGRIINVSSIAGKDGAPNLSHYSASKFAVLGFTKAIAKELAPYDITVNAVCPGIIYSSMWEYMSELRKEPDESAEEFWKRTITERIPLGRPQTPEDVGQAVVFLAGADNITGQAVNVDGGILMQ